MESSRCHRVVHRRRFGSSLRGPVTRKEAALEKLEKHGIRAHLQPRRNERGRQLRRPYCFSLLTFPLLVLI
jgi:hypothetical protein